MTRIYKEAIEGVAPETREKILQKYKKTAKPGESVVAIMDETNAYYAEQVLGNKNTLEKFIEVEPTLKEKQVVDLPDNYAVFVTLSDGKEYVAIIEVDAKINEDFIVHDGKGGKYHTTVTVFEPDVTRNGEPFDYAEELLQNPNNIELQIKRRPSNESAIGKKHPNTSKELPSVISIPQKT